MTTVIPIAQPQQFIYIPVATAIPMFAAIVPMQAPTKVQQFIPPDVWGVINASNNFTLRQHVKVLPKNCCGCPPCVAQENTYSVFAGIRADQQVEFLRIDEVSDDWNRCCCKPFHPVRLEVRQYVPLPGLDRNVSDYSFLQQDLQTDFSRYDRRQQYEQLKKTYYRFPVIFSMIRHDGTRCCYKNPCGKWLDTYVCFSCCQDGMSVYAGPLADDPKGEKGRPYMLDDTRKIGGVVQPLYGGWCYPTVDLFTGEDAAYNDAYARMQGPFFFGGWMEMCCDLVFRVKNTKIDVELGQMTRMKPHSLVGAMVQLTTEADVYSININPQAGLTVEQKLTMLTAQVLTDYMFFEGETRKCYTDSNGTTYCYLCYCSLIGRLSSCYIAFNSNNN